ncbi:MAG: hypothetical protein ACE5D7_00005, partial [Fidelibacterota bacterium]
MKKLSIIISIFVFVYLGNLIIHSMNNSGRDIPAPTQFQLHKEKRKEFKKKRQQWMEQMHRTAPDVDWRKIDMETRRQKHQTNTRLRQQYFSANPGSSSPNRTTFSSREITGTWWEKGSNNLAGRIHTAEIDFENGS